MIIYIDAECKCHVSNPDGIYVEIEAPEQFNGKCSAYIEGFRVRPEGFTFTRADGVVFGPKGSSVSPWKDDALLEATQEGYEESHASADKAYAEGVNSI